MTCNKCPFWDKTGIVAITPEGVVRECLRNDFPTYENEGCTFESKWEELYQIGKVE